MSVSKETYVCVKRDLCEGQKRPMSVLGPLDLCFGMVLSLFYFDVDHVCCFCDSFFGSCSLASWYFFFF